MTLGVTGSVWWQVSSSWPGEGDFEDGWPGVLSVPSWVFLLQSLLSETRGCTNLYRAMDNLKGNTPEGKGDVSSA